MIHWVYGVVRVCVCVCVCGGGGVGSPVSNPQPRFMCPGFRPSWPPVATVCGRCSSYRPFWLPRCWVSLDSGLSCTTDGSASLSVCLYVCPLRRSITLVIPVSHFQPHCCVTTVQFLSFQISRLCFQFHFYSLFCHVDWTGTTDCSNNPNPFFHPQGLLNILKYCVRVHKLHRMLNGILLIMKMKL